MKNSYKNLISDIAAKLFTALESFPYPCWFFDRYGCYAGCSIAAENEDIRPENLPGDSSRNYRICRCSNTGELFCSAVLLSDAPGWEEGYILTLFREILQGKEYRELLNMRKLRSFYAGQLANLEAPTADLKAFLHTTNYTSKYPRAAILILFANDIGPSSAIHNAADSPSSMLSLAVEQAAFFSEEDIFGPIADNLFLYFKAVRSETLESRIDYLNKTAGELYAMCENLFLKLPVIAVGSVYISVNDLHQSYNEASFLIQNARFLQDSQETDDHILLIQNYLAEYLSGQFLTSQYDILYRDYHRFFDSHPLEKEILAPLSFSNINMIRTGELLDIHRNTVLQRYHKIESETGLSPRNSISDRLLLRSYLMNSHKSVVLHAGVHIQRNSVQYRGLQYLSKLVNEKSGGTLQLQIGHISTAGNNIELLRIIESGGLDIGICGNAALYTVAGELASLIELPFLFSSVEEAQTILNQIILPVLNDEISNLNLLSPAFWVIGSRHITSNTPVRLPDDLKGKHIRTMNKGALYRYFEHIGAVPVVIGYDTLNHAIRTGLVECQENPYVNILGIRLYEVQRYINEMVYYYNISPVFINKDSYNALSEQHCSILAEALQETTDYLVGEQAKYNSECRNILISEKEMIPITPSEEEISRWISHSDFLFQNHPLQSLLQSILESRNALRKKTHEI